MTHLTRQILRQIESLGYRHEHAPDEGPDQVHLARIEGTMTRRIDARAHWRSLLGSTSEDAGPGRTGTTTG